MSTSPFERLEIARFETHPRSHFREAGHYDLFEARIGIEGRIINLGIYRDIEAERLHV
jgi:hypothetical protein